MRLTYREGKGSGSRDYTYLVDLLYVEAMSVSASATSLHRNVFPVMKGYKVTEKLGTGTFATVYKAHKKVV